MSPLADLRVVDLSRDIAGSYCTKLLADAGADVVKIEPSDGDPLRSWATSAEVAPGSSGALFHYLNASKRSVTAAPGLPVPPSLAASCDVLVETGQLSTGDIDVICASNPLAVVVSITPFGKSGPWAARPWTEFTLQALCGSTASRGIATSDPIAAGGRIGEWLGGVYAAVGALGAWRLAQARGSGEHVDVSLLECMTVSMTPYPAVHASLGGASLSPPRTVEVPSIEPTSDGLVGFCTITAQQFSDFLVMIERPDLIGDAAFATSIARQARRDEFSAIVREWTTDRTTADIVELAGLLRIPATPIGTPDGILDLDHFAARGVFIDNPAGFVQPRPPYRVTGVPGRALGAAPQPGADDGVIEWQPRPRADRGAAHDPLDGIRVLDLTAFWSGPAASQMLAALGAEVIKVESVQRPDGMRFTSTRQPPVDEWWEWSPIFQAVNVGKRGVTLNLASKDGRQQLLGLAAHADVLIENFAPRVLDDFGLTWKVLHDRNPHLEVVRMPAFGLDGPWRDRTGFAQTMEQVSGMAWMTGFSDGPPILPRGPCDPLAGMHAAFATLVALAERGRSGTGRLVEVTMVEAALNVAAEMVIEKSAYGGMIRRCGNRSPSAAPQGVYRCAGDERWLAVTVADDAQWQALRTVIGDPLWARDPALATVAGRQACHDEIDAAIAAWCRDLQVATAEAQLVAAGVAAAAVTAGALSLDHDVLHQRGFVECVDHPVLGRLELPSVPFRFRSRGRRPWFTTPAPTLGQHTEELLAAITGATNAELERLTELQVIGTRPRGA